MTPLSRSRQPRSGRIIGIDPGERRIGVAAADLRIRVAVPLTSIDAGDDPAEAVARLAREENAEAVVVGLALSLSGALGPQGRRTQTLANALSQRLDVPVHTWDERLTSSEARRRLPRTGRSHRGKRRPKGDVDALAAAIILQAFLDSQRGPGRG